MGRFFQTDAEADVERDKANTMEREIAQVAMREVKDELDTDKLRTNMEIYRDNMKASLAVIDESLAKMTERRDDRRKALAVAEIVLRELGDGKAVETIKAVTAEIKPKGKNRREDEAVQNEVFPEPEPA